MTIHDLSLKFKGLHKNTDVLLSVLIIVVSLTSFLLGRVSMTENITTIEQKTEVFDIEASVGSLQILKESVQETNVATDTKNEEGGYVASKSGTKYHLPWCGSARQIKEENKIWFKTKAEAEAQGYTPASNCKGI